MRERILGFVDVPGEAQALPGSGRLLPAPPVQAREDLLLTVGTGQSVCQGGPDLIEMTLCWGYFWQGIFYFFFFTKSGLATDMEKK